jgi:hypothetical protein
MRLGGLYTNSSDACPSRPEHGRAPLAWHKSAHVVCLIRSIRSAPTSGASGVARRIAIVTTTPNELRAEQMRVGPAGLQVLPEWLGEEPSEMPNADYGAVNVHGTLGVRRRGRQPRLSRADAGP